MFIGSGVVLSNNSLRPHGSVVASWHIYVMILILFFLLILFFSSYVQIGMGQQSYVVYWVSRNEHDWDEMSQQGFAVSNN